MKKWLIAVLLIALLPLTVAGAETTVDEKVLDYYSVTLNEEAGTLAVQTERRGAYTVVDTDGNVLSDGYESMSAQNGYYTVRAGEEINNTGMLDGQGKLIVPMQYGDTEYFSDRWQAGIVLTEATSDNYDYQSFLGEKCFFLIERVDLYYRGTKIGSLDRSAYSSATAYGDYLYVRDRDKNMHYYDNQLNESGYEGSTVGEYDSQYASGSEKFIHCGTGTEAFTEGCTLTEDQVETAVMPRMQKDGYAIVGLDGKEIALVTYNTVYDYSGDYARVLSENRMNGLLDRTGAEVVACVYDKLENYSIRCGYVAAVKDGMLGFVNLETGAETGFEYAENAIKERTPFAMLTENDGKIAVLSAAAGMLPDRYDEARSEISMEVPAFAAEKDGQAGVIDLVGNVIIPLDGTYDDVYDFTFAKNGTLILAQDNIDRKYHLFTVTYDLTVPERPAAEATEAPAGWVCPECGNTNDDSANFCPTDGTKRPEAVL